MVWLAEAEEPGPPGGHRFGRPRPRVGREATSNAIGIRASGSPRWCAGARTSRPSPDPTSYRLACAWLGADSARSLAVEDSPHGVAAAVAAGLLHGGGPSSAHPGPRLSAADLVLDSLEVLPLADAVERAGRRSPPGLRLPARRGQPLDAWVLTPRVAVTVIWSWPR